MIATILRSIVLRRTATVVAVLAALGWFAYIVYEATPADIRNGSVSGRLKEWCCVAAKRYGGQTEIAKAAAAWLDGANVKPLSRPLEELLADSKHPLVPSQPHALLGKAAPQFALSNEKGNVLKLSDALKTGPVIVVFYYGYWCDHCVAQLVALNRDVSYFDELGATIFALSADPPLITQERFQQYGKFSFPALSDTGHLVARQYGTSTAPDSPDGEDDVLHGTFLVDTKGVVRWANVGTKPFMDNRTLIAEVAKLVRETDK